MAFYSTLIPGISLRILIKMEFASALFIRRMHTTSNRSGFLTGSPWAHTLAQRSKYPSSKAQYCNGWERGNIPFTNMHPATVGTTFSFPFRGRCYDGSTPPTYSWGLLPNIPRFLLLFSTSASTVILRLLIFFITFHQVYTMAVPSGNAKALRQALNEKTAKSFGIAMGSFIALFILCHWTRHLFYKYGNGKRSPVTTAVVRLSRYVVSVSRLKFANNCIGESGRLFRRESSNRHHLDVFYSTLYSGEST